MLRHDNAVLRHVGRVRYESADWAWLAALTQFIPRGRWAEVFPVMPATLLASGTASWRRGSTTRASGASQDARRQARHRPPCRPPGEGKSAVGTPPDPRRTGQARRDDRAVYRVGDSAFCGHRSGTAALGPGLAAVPARLGRRDRRSRFLHVDAVLLKRKYVLVFTEHGTRRMQIGGVTANPTGEWIVQQARNLSLSFGKRFDARPRTDPPETCPRWPDQRILTRRLTPRRTGR
jgi:putative transposase